MNIDSLVMGRVNIEWEIKLYTIREALYYAKNRF